MCGIVGYVGGRLATDVILEGLEKLEYRGYDSSGVAILNSDKIVYRKYAGRLSNLISSIEKESIDGTLGIGHTRWATHGAPSDVNAHPHTNKDGTIAVVHNGIIENYMTLKNELIERGFDFESDTDTEIIAKLLDF